MVEYKNHEYFYFSDATIQKRCLSGYRMGGTITDVKCNSPIFKKTSYTASQSLIIPEDINPDDRFKYST